MAEQELTEQLLEWVRSHYFGKYRGVVMDNADETGRGRLLVKVPALLGDLTVWAMPCVPYAGAKVGFYTLPEAETGVWVEFEGGDLSYPVWTGFFWGDNEIPDENSADIKILKTQKHTIRLDDAADEIEIANSSSSSVTLATDVLTQCMEAKHTVAGEGITSELTAGKLEVTAASVKINKDALEVT